MRRINWNTVLLSAGLAVGGWVGKELYGEIKATHDAVLGQNYQIADLRVRLSAVEVEIQKLKERRP